MRKYFNDKVVLVTGAASGIGRHLSISLAQAGCRVYATDIDRQELVSLEEVIRSLGGSVRCRQLDVSCREDVRKVLLDVRAESNKLDIIINNAGICIGGEVRNMKSEHWDKIINVNLMGVLYGTLEAYALMIEQGFGQIVNISSYLGLVGAPTSTAYNTTKFAVVGLTTSLRHEASPLGIKVNTVCPGYVATNLIDRGIMLEVSAKAMKKLIPLKFYPPEKAAQKIMDGMVQDQAIIIFPFHAKLLWWINRVNVNLLVPVFKSFMKNIKNIQPDFRRNQ